MKDDIQNQLENFKELFEKENYIYNQQLKKASAFQMTADELTSYKSEVSKFIPSNLILSDNHYRLMKFWETEENDKSQDPLLIMNDIFKKEIFQVNIEEKITTWRKSYVQKLNDQSKIFHELTKEAIQLINNWLILDSHYGIVIDDIPLQNEEKKLTYPLGSLINELFRKKQ